MKKALLLALAGVFITTVCSVQPADARGKLLVINGTKYAAKVSITYYTALCKDDHPTVAANGRWSVNSGLCTVKDSVIVLRDGKGKDHTCASKRGQTLQAVWRVHIMNDPAELEEMARNNKISLSTNNTDPFCGVASA